MELLTLSNQKVLKAREFGYLNAILHLAPHNLSGYNVCPGASAGCIATCLNTSGMGKLNVVQQARIRRTKWFFEDRKSFLGTLRGDLWALTRQAKKLGLKPCVRLNGTSDIALWDTPQVGIVEEFTKEGITFYDYTSNPAVIKNKRTDSYHLTFSRKETHTDEEVTKRLLSGLNVAVVFKGNVLPSVYLGYTVINGDVNDLRFLDPPRSIVGLLAKGKAKKDTDSGFVVNNV